MNWSDDRIAAYVDGELDAATRADLEAALAADPVLAERVERERALRRRIDAAFGAVLDEPVPQRLLEALRPAEPVDLAAERARRRPRWQWPEWGAMAASLAIGLVVGRALLPAAADAPFDVRDGRLLARGALAEALSQRLAAEAPDGITLPVSFAAGDGRICRSFALAREALAGLACRGAAGWEVEVVAASVPGDAPAGAVRQAGSALPEPVLRAIDTRIEGEPFDAAAERAARERGWRR